MVNYYENVKAHPEIFSHLAFNEVLFAKYNCPFQLPLNDKWWQHNYFMYIVTGKAAIHTPLNSWTLTAGDAVFMKKGACIKEKFFDEELCIMSFFIPDNYLRAFLRENSALLQHEDLPPVTNDLLIRIKLNEIMKTFYDSMLPYFNYESRAPEQLLELKFRELLYNVIVNSSNKELIAYLKTLLIDHDNLQQIMESNCLFNLRLEDYAKLCNRSLSSFKRDFQIAYQVPPGVWLLTRKLERARHLLLVTDKSVNDLSFECGFENSTHFIRVFKKQFGAPPLQFRKQSIAI